MDRIVLTPWFYYDVFDNGKRIIHIPSPELKRVQRLILRKYFKPYWQSKGVNETASAHCGKKWLMKLDIKDFFNSISKDQIKEIISRYVFAEYNPIIADPHNKKISDEEHIFFICTVNGKLPTGAPTSPYIANLILKDFDSQMEEYCKTCDVTYSRYMDDLFFSTDGAQYLLSLVELEVLRQFKEMGFGVNVEKIKYISSNKRQQVLGLGVNNPKPVLTKDDKRMYRAYFYNMLSPIQFNKQKLYKEHELEVLGHLAYIKSVDKDFYTRIVFYIFNILVKFNLLKKTCLKNLVRTLNYNRGN